jgi:hypothetical protein
MKKGLGVLLLLVAGVRGSALVRARALSLGASCETAVRSCLRAGLSHPDRDMLARARTLDAETGDHSALPLRGVPLYSTCLNRINGVCVDLPLEEQGALLWRAVSQDSHPLPNPRDPEFGIDTDESTGVASAVSAVAMDKVAAAVLPAVDGQVPEAVGWVGLMGLAVPSEQGHTVICGSHFEDLLTLRQALFGPDSSPRPPAEAIKPLSGVRIAFTTDVALDGGRVEVYVSNALRTALEVFEGLGAECVKMKRADLEALQPDPSCAVLLCPRSLAAAPRLGSIVPQHKTCQNTVSSFLEGKLSVCLPAGVVAGEDDGYDSSLNELLPLEGLPVALTLIALQPTIKSTHTVLAVAEAYLAVTRWSSEVFAQGMSRETAKEDMDDARELYGIYFQLTLLRYLAKKRKSAYA